MTDSSLFPQARGAHAALQLQAALLSQPAFGPAVAAFATRLAELLRLSRASVGVVQNGCSTVVAISHGAGVDARQEGIGELAAAMDEAIDQAATVAYPAPSQQRAQVNFAHARFARREGVAACSIPLVDFGAVIGAVTLERAPDQPLSEAETQLCEHLVSLAAPVLRLKRSAERPWWSRARDRVAALREGVGAPGRLRMKLLAAGAALLGSGALFIPLPYEVSAPARLEGAVQRALVAASDEFAVLLTQVERAENTIIVAKRLLDAVGAPFDIGGRERYVSCSIGISVFPGDSTDRETLLQNAAAALVQAKKRGGNSYAFHSGELSDRSLRYINLHGDLRKSLERGELRLWYQPKFDTATRRLAGAEALLRWQHGERGMVSPAEFIPLAEETGLIVPIGAWVLAEACRQIDAWRRAGLAPVKIAVNVSGRQLAEPGFLDTVRSALEGARVDPRLVQVELTESMLMDRADEGIALLHRIRETGLTISIDDFGTGYSSLSYLGRLPIDELKIDRSFLAQVDAGAGRERAPIAGAIIALAHGLGLSVVAEGVETETQWAYLRERECDQCQGFLFGRPAPAADFGRLLAPAAGVVELTPAA